MKYALFFSQSHPNFRRAEVEGVCRALGIDYSLFSNIGIDSPLQEIDLPDEGSLKKLCTRTILLKTAYEFYCKAINYAELKELIKQKANLFIKYEESNETWAIRVRPFGRKKGVESIGQARKVAEWMPFRVAPIDLKKPVNKFVVMEEYLQEKDTEPSMLYFLREITNGQIRRISKINLTERCYIGNTTMDPELALIQANITAIREGSLVLDPFCGTGGLLIPAAEFGASVLGTEINYQIAHAKGRSSRHTTKVLTDEAVEKNFIQYGTQGRFLALLLADASKHELWAPRPIFDAIVADPPYGVREKSRKIGVKERKDHWTLPKTPNEDRSQRFPEKQVYDLDSVFSDILDLASQILVVCGRVSFWFPVLLCKYSDDILPVHPCLKLVSNCEQGLTTRTSRRLLTYEKVREPLGMEKASSLISQFDENSFRDVALLNPRQ